jgi:hypothetical protein
MAGAEIPRKSAPLRRRAPPPRAYRDNLPCKLTRYVPDPLSRVLPPKIRIEFETHAGTDLSGATILGISGTEKTNHGGATVTR